MNPITNGSIGDSGGKNDWRMHGDIAWFFDLVWNCVGYATVLIPGYLLIKYYQRKGGAFDLTHRQSLYKSLITLLVFGWKRSPNLDDESPSTITSSSQKQQQRNSIIDRIRASWPCGHQLVLVACFVGLLVPHIAWGFYQEKMMTRDYYYRDSADKMDESSMATSTLGALKKERFKESQFIVFLNRIAALILSAGYLSVSYLWWRRRKDVTTRNRGAIVDDDGRGQLEHAAPFYKYSYASLSNILSSWCQYEALKYVTFPTQVLGKAAKIVPTMIGGRLMYKKSYPYHQYAIAALISSGVAMFLMSSTKEDPHKKYSDTTSMSGLILILGYLICDSFTSNYQSSLFRGYKLSQMQMMCGMSVYSCLFSLIPLVQRGNFVGCLRFMTRHPDFAVDCLTTSLCSAVGQVCIYFTIAEFGPVALATMMTVRQAFSILLSCLYFGHPIDALGIAGICVVFAALLFGQCLNRRLGGGGGRKR